jgi:F-type H+-transporting ATPase subunit b
MNLFGLPLDAAFWATAALVLFVGLMIYLGVPKMITGMLDKRIKAIETELAEAQRLRGEAQALLASYATKRQEAEAEAADIVQAAKEEAARLADEAATALDTLIARRTRAVEDKISQAEAQALAEVRGRSADVAIEAARVLLTRQMADKGDALVSKAIADVGAKLN